MEDSFDFQKVGQMFVMQYYTQMHKDPAQMHKFYKDSSSFIHGGSEIGSGEKVSGRAAIHDKIVSLDLQQVHTKIRQVDSHATVPNEVGPGIVIQVTGELSIARETMRPFVQTFVLASEAPKKYFIYNDIFRYQVYDEDLVSETEPREGEAERPSSKEMRSPLISDEALYRTSEPTISGGGVVGQPPETLDDSSPVPTSGTGHADVMHENTGHWRDQFVDPQTNGLPEEAHMTLEEEPNYPHESEEEEETPPTIREEEVVPGDSKLEGVTENKPTPGTWASRISQQPLPQRETKPANRKQERPVEKKPFSSSNPINSRSAPDSHQVFVGGLPTGTTENELREVFAQFGKILEVRVNPKNFGFVVFDNEESVQNVMMRKDDSPLHLREKRLNIEEKRQSVPKGGFGSGGPGRKPMGTSNISGKAPLRPSNRLPRRS